MKRKSLYIIGLFVVISIFTVTRCSGQDIPQSVLIGRIKANRSQYPQWDKGHSLKDEVLATGHDVVRRPIKLDDFVKCLNCPPERDDDNSLVKFAARGSDLVATGTVVGNISSLTTKNDFIFTDSEFKIDEIWRGSISPEVLDDSGTMDEITITSPGGRVKINTHRVEEYVSNRMSLQIGHKYLLFLKYLPESHSYKAFHRLIGFDLTGSRPIRLYTQITPPNSDIIANKSEYVAALRASVERVANSGGHE